MSGTFSLGSIDSPLSLFITPHSFILTDTSEHIRFYILVFLVFPLVSSRFRAVD